ncbi:MAG: type II toxin-antitoxin system death-on-curing family toxin [Hyphomicrobiales bacterium]|nr:type II toxin-antitoxin system death-on-curing family toxin [Hyphomicrobiales bacterium]
MRIIGIETLIAAHGESLELFGGAAGIRDRGVIEAALGRADHLAAYGDSLDVIDIAAATAASVCRAHGFIDGNKRAAFITLVVTLQLNGHYLDAEEKDAADAVLRLAAGEISENAFRDWVRAHAVDD